MQVRQLITEEDRAVSGLIREPSRMYRREAEWRRLERYGRQRALGQDIAHSDVARMVDECRAEDSQD